VAALRAGFAATMKDKEFLAEAEKMGLDISPLGGEDLQNLLAKLYALPPRVIDMAKRSLTTRVPAK